jgi:hypothetical protein
MAIYERPPPTRTIKRSGKDSRKIDTLQCVADGQ